MTRASLRGEQNRKPYDTSRRRFCARLYALGFKREDNSADPLCFFKIVGNRRIDVQLWKDGNHRASNALLGKAGGWRWSTLPTDFRRFTEMEPAIERERTRTDHATPG